MRRCKNFIRPLSVTMTVISLVAISPAHAQTCIEPAVNEYHGDKPFDPFE